MPTTGTSSEYGEDAEYLAPAWPLAEEHGG
jgi:hypothetical protein